MSAGVSNDRPTLREYIEDKIANVEKAVTLAVLNEQKARFVDKDTFREKMAEACGDIDKLDGRMKVLEESKAKLEGKADVSQVNRTQTFAVVSLLVAVVSLVVAIVKVLIG